MPDIKREGLWKAVCKWQAGACNDNFMVEQWHLLIASVFDSTNTDHRTGGSGFSRRRQMVQCNISPSRQRDTEGG